MIDPGLHGKVVVITGGNSQLGIGAATARAFAAQGAAGFIHYFRPVPTALSESGELRRSGETGDAGEASYLALQHQTPDALVAEIRAAGGQAAAWEADLADPLAATH